ncbi:MAG: 30S ribosome-binding factor RbfA [Myxococcales bacterium]|nr:MAG: 30S ribosome-binding factor RbfA [Myxococcales bacterium]
MGSERAQPEFKRSQRINRLLRDELSALVRERLRDPRIGDVLITGVQTTDDLRHAKVFFTLSGAATPTEETYAETQKGLERAVGFLRGELGRMLRVKRLPEIRFERDNSFDTGERIESLLRALHQGEDDD